MDEKQIKNVVEAALLAAGRPLTLDQMVELFTESDGVERTQVRSALNALESEYEDRGVELKEVGGGFRLQVRPAFSGWVSRLWAERPSRYSRALLETLALVAYRQPITRGEIEDIRGVSVSSSIMKTLQEREWVRVVGHRDVPGKPAMYGTTREFLDYFNLKSLEDLPPLAELRDIDSINAELELVPPEQAQGAQAGSETGEQGAEAATGAPGEQSAAGASDSNVMPFAPPGALDAEEETAGGLTTDEAEEDAPDSGGADAAVVPGAEEAGEAEDDASDSRVSEVSESAQDEPSASVDDEQRGGEPDDPQADPETTLPGNR